MYNLLAFTNRHLCTNDFFNQIEKICKLNNSKDYNIKIVLREKDLSEEEYFELSSSVLNICKSNNTGCILHSYYDIANKLNCKKIHLPLHVLKEHPELSHNFDTIGVSVHSPEEAVIAEKLNASYITAGHIFETDCKKGLKGRGLQFLKEVTSSVSIPVYAIGGINKDNIDSVLETGAFGACMMSTFMKL